MDLRNRIDAAPMSRAQLWIIGVCVALNMSDGFDVLAMAFSASSISNEWDLSGAQLGLLLSAALFGMAAGSIFVSQIATLSAAAPPSSGAPSSSPWAWGWRRCPPATRCC